MHRLRYLLISLACLHFAADYFLFVAFIVVAAKAQPCGMIVGHILHARLHANAGNMLVAVQREDIVVVIFSTPSLRFVRGCAYLCWVSLFRLV
jgi:hypothetical protein